MAPNHDDDQDSRSRTTVVTSHRDCRRIRMCHARKPVHRSPGDWNSLYYLSSLVLYGRTLPLPPYRAQDRPAEVCEAWDGTWDQTGTSILQWCTSTRCPAAITGRRAPHGNAGLGPFVCSRSVLVLLAGVLNQNLTLASLERHQMICSLGM